MRPGDVVVEAGANIGVHTLPLAKRVGPGGRVYAFEPQRLVFQTLCANAALNGLTNVDCRQAACGADRGEILVPEFDFSAANNFGGLSLGRHAQGERVPVVTIDSLALPACRFIKADVEGMELQVLKGARETIARCRPVLYVENDRADSSPALIAYLLSLGYRLYLASAAAVQSEEFFPKPREFVCQYRFREHARASNRTPRCQPQTSGPSRDLRAAGRILRPAQHPATRPPRVAMPGCRPAGGKQLPAANQHADQGRTAATGEILVPRCDPSRPTADALLFTANQADCSANASIWRSTPCNV